MKGFDYGRKNSFGKAKIYNIWDIIRQHSQQSVIVGPLRIVETGGTKLKMPSEITPPL